MSSTQPRQFLQPDDLQDGRPNSNVLTMRGGDRLLSSQKLAEYFVSAEVIAEFLLITRRQVLEMARKGDIPAHLIGRGRRNTWRFKLSEVDLAISSGARKHVCASR